MDKYDGPWQGNVFKQLVLSAFSWECVDKYDGPWQGIWFIKGVYQLFPGRVCTNTMGLGRGNSL